MLCCFITTDVLHHALDGDGLAAVGIDLVAVDALEQDALAVDQQVAVLDLHLAEADVDRDDFEHLAGVVLEREQQLVEVGRFGGPLERVRRPAAKSWPRASCSVRVHVHLHAEARRPSCPRHRAAAPSTVTAAASAAGVVAP